MRRPTHVPYGIQTAPLPATSDAVAGRCLIVPAQADCAIILTDEKYIHGS